MPDPVQNKLLNKVFSASVQALAVQFLGVLFFYITSFYLSKNDFGIISWANATAITITSVIGLGLEQIIIRRVASSHTSNWAAAACFMHNAVFSVITIVILTILLFIWGDGSDKMSFLPYFFIIQSFTFIATPLKQFLNAKERFTPYAVIALISNLLKVVLCLTWVFYYKFSIYSVLVIMAVANILELAALLLYVIKRSDFVWKFRFIAYKKLLKEALPQYIAVLFDSSLSRIDWILMGILSTNIATANYSFSYRAFEVLKLPIVVIGTILLPRFSKIMQYGDGLNKPQVDLVSQIFTIEVCFSVFIFLILNIGWSPWVDFLTNNKYGAVNNVTFMLLSACIPFHFVINLMWIICFASRKYRTVANITMIIAIVNFIANLIFIPLFKERGAAIAFLLSSVLQAVLYFYVIYKHIPIRIGSSLVFLLTAAVLLIALKQSNLTIAFQLLIAIAVYCAMLFTQKQMRWSKIKMVLTNLR